MKKLTSLVLSVLMVVSLFSCLFTGTAVSATEATESTVTNLITNGGFDTNVNTDGYLPGLVGCSVDSFTSGKWYRTTAGNSPSVSPDLDSTGHTTTGYPAFFGDNDQIVTEPTNAANSVLRAVEDLYTQVEPENGKKYTLSLKLKLPNKTTSLTSFKLSLVSPTLDESGNATTELVQPFNITDAKSNQTISTANGASTITFNGTSEEWQNVTINFTAKKNDGVEQDTYDQYTSPVLLKIQFDAGDDAELPTGYESSIQNPNNYKKRCIYFDDFAIVNCTVNTTPVFYDIKGKILDEQAYANVTTAVNGDKITATVNYDTESGAYHFLGWYDENGNNVSSEATYTFTATAGKTYTPRIGSTNLLGTSGSFEGMASDTYLGMTAPTAPTPGSKPIFPTGNKWGINRDEGYFGCTWDGEVVDKNGKKYTQTAGGSINQYGLGSGGCNVTTDAAHSGTNALSIKAKYFGYPLAIEGLETNTDYVLSFYWRYNSATTPLMGCGIATTVNIGKSNTSNEYTTPLGACVTESDNPFVLVNDTSTANIKTNDTEWHQVTLEFNSKNFATLYFVLSAIGKGGTNILIDDLVCRKTNNDTVFAADVEFRKPDNSVIANSSNEIGSAKLTGNFDGTYTANVEYDRESGAYAFGGWSYEGNIIAGSETQETFTFNVRDYNDLTKLKAVIISANLLTDAGSFESYTANSDLRWTDGTTAPTGYKWGSCEGDNYTYEYWVDRQTKYGKTKDKINAELYVEPHKGNSMLFFSAYNRTLIRALENLQQNTDYTLTFYTYGISSDSCITKVAIANTYSGYNISATNANTADGVYAYQNIEYAEGWKKVQLSFNSGNNNNKLYLHLLQPGGSSYIDDLSLIETTTVDVQFVDTQNQDITENITNEILPTITDSEKPGHFVANANYEESAFDFIGWYDGDIDGELVSTDKSFEFPKGRYSKLTAKVVSRNLLTNAGSFESYTNEANLKVSSTETETTDSSGRNKIREFDSGPKGDKWGIYYNNINLPEHGYKDISYYTIKISRNNKTISPHSGNNMLKFETYGRDVIRALENLKQNTDYTLTFYTYGPSSGSRITKVAIANDYLDYNLSSADANTEGTIIIKTLTYAEGWQKVQLSFNSGDKETLYLHLLQAGTAYIDDLYLNVNTTVDVKFVDTQNKDITENIKNEILPTITKSEENGYSVANANYDDGAFEFIGWYDGDINGTLVSTDKSFKFRNGIYSKLIAKVVSRNLLTDAGSFESYTNGKNLKVPSSKDTFSGAPTGNQWGVYYHKENDESYGYQDRSWYSIQIKNSGTITPHSGNNMLQFTTYGRDVIRALEHLKQNTDYTLTFYTYGSSSNDCIKKVAIADDYKNYNLYLADANTKGTIIIKELTYDTGWQKVQLSFNSGDNETLYLHLLQVNTAYIDDLTCYATNLTAEDLGITTSQLKYNGASIRAYAGEDKPQALRHKFEIKKDLIENQIALYGELVEYGSVAIRTDYLGGKELIKDGKYNYKGNEKKAVTGVTYIKGTATNIIFINKEDSIVFTAALTNIGLRTDGSINYTMYGKEYSVRNYLIFEKNGIKTTVYTETKSYSVFDVMEHIIETYEYDKNTTDAILRNDYNTIQNIFKQYPKQEEAYDTWKQAQNP